jgi:tRNA(Ile)-lysidine synthase
MPSKQTFDTRHSALGTLQAPSLPPGANVWAAFSGGLDSTVLLHRLHAAGLPVRALHVNHHLQAVANRWVEHCKEFCAQLGVPIYVLDVRIDPNDPEGPEAAARRARYESFATLMKAGDCLATAHHQDDQAETVLLRLLRGAGVAGLAAMRAELPFAGGTLWRPLLRQSRAALKEYAERHALPWVEDPHNQDPRYARSFVRHEIFPRFTQKWPQALEMLARTAEHCAEAVELLDEVAAADLSKSPLPAKRGEVRAPHGARGEGPVSVQYLLSLPTPRRHNLLRYWAARSRHPAPPFEALARLEREVLRARPDAAPLLAWGDIELRRFRDALHLMRRLPPPPQGLALEWDGRRDLALPPGCGVLAAVKPARAELPLRVTFVEGGERLKPAGSRYTRTLRNLFQEEAIPPWIRERMPLVHLDGELAAVADRWESAALKKLRGQRGCRYEWRHDLPGDPA